MVRECRVCGRWFGATSKNNTLCSPECREISKKEHAKISKHKRAYLKKNKGKNNSEQIVNLNMEAKAMGMSYGRYVAYLSMKEGK